MQRLCALCSHGGAGQIPAYILNISMSAVAWWDLRGSRATIGGATTTAVPTVMFSCPASDVAPALGTSARGSIKKTELVPLSSKKDFLCISPNCAKVAVKHSVYTHIRAGLLNIELALLFSFKQDRISSVAFLRVARAGNTSAFFPAGSCCIPIVKDMEEDFCVFLIFLLPFFIILSVFGRSPTWKLLNHNFFGCTLLDLHSWQFLGIDL